MVLHGIVSEIRVLSSDIKSLVVVWNFSNGDLESLQRRFWRAMPGGHQRVVPTAPGSLFQKKRKRRKREKERKKEKNNKILEKLEKS